MKNTECLQKIHKDFCKNLLSVIVSVTAVCHNDINRQNPDRGKQENP